MKNNSFAFSKIITLRERFIVNLIPLIGVIFLTFYNQIVCPFLESLPYQEELINLLVIYFFQVVIREILLARALDTDKLFSIGDHFHSILVLSWILAGFFAAALHEMRYHDQPPLGILAAQKPWPSDYPWHSHLKVLSGYWLLGGGLLTQLELSIGERFIRNYILNNPDESFQYCEQISSRITRGNFFYTLVPSLSVLIMVIRYAIQDKAIPIVTAYEFFYVGAVFVGTAILAAAIYGKMLKEDTNSIVQAIHKIGEGDFTSRLVITRQDELGQIAAGINEMTVGLKQREIIRASFRHFVPPDIAEDFIQRYSSGKDMRQFGENRQVAVLMCDIRSFSNISENMEPIDVARMLNNYFDKMVQAITKEGGIVDKFIGDAVMAVFGLLDSKGNPSLQAVKAAMGMRKSLVDVNAHNKSEGLPELNNGIGIHYGNVIASYLGSPERLEFTVLGSTVNVAARLEAQAKPPNPPIVISNAVVEKLEGKIPTIEGEEIELKGVGKRRLHFVKSEVNS